MLNSKNIYLRTIEPRDAALMLQWENNPDNWAVSNTLVPFSEHLVLQYVNSLPETTLPATAAAALPSRSPTQN